MPSVLRREALANEHMAEVTAAGRALDLDAIAIRVGYPSDSTLDLLIE